MSERGKYFWDIFFLRMAKQLSTASKDPSTKVGAVIVRPDRTIASMGYNGFPRGFPDDAELYENRELKYKYIVHAEVNAIVTAREPLHGYTLYTWPFCPCSGCTKLALQAGIRSFVTIYASDEVTARWGDDLKVSRRLMGECGVLLSSYDPELL